MRILQVNKLYYPWIGGVETVAQDIAEYLNGKNGVLVTNLVCQPRGKRRLDTVNGVPTYRAGSLGMALGMPLSLDFFRLFRKLAEDADVIFLHHPFPPACIAYWLFGTEEKGGGLVPFRHCPAEAHENTAHAVCPLRPCPRGTHFCFK